LIFSSLRARTVLLVLLAVLVAQAATVTVFTLYRRHVADNWGSDVLIPIVRMAKTALERMTPEQRDQFIRENADENWRLVPETQVTLPEFFRRPDMGGPPPADAPPGMRGGLPPEMHGDFTPDARGDAPPLLRRLNRRLGGEARVQFAALPEPAFWIRLMAQDGPWWLIVPVERLRPPLPLGGILAMGAIILGILAVALAYAVQVTRPLRKLTEATESVAQGKMVTVDVSGPLEIRTLAERFNAMTAALDEAQKTQRTLLAGLPHDLKGPLARLRLRAELATDPEMAQGLLRDTHDMQAIVDQFLSYVRGLEPASYSMQPMQLAQWLTERVAHCQQAGQAIELLRADVCTVNADAQMLSRLLDNLVDNALHHGAPPVQVSLVVQGKQAALTVRDHGPGIDAGLRAAALQPFSRLDSARTRTGSVGLGLAIAERIARLHGGTFTLSDPPDGGGGLCALVSLPCAH
jgi:two-component system, OmpR family, osmolarity sensor histidine kinase EnvZ